jgi:hypothetical protein
MTPARIQKMKDDQRLHDFQALILEKLAKGMGCREANHVAYDEVMHRRVYQIKGGKVSWRAV